MALCFVPVLPAALRDWAVTGVRSGAIPAFAVTPAMASAFGFTSSTAEDAEYTALCVASVACLIGGGPRLVAVVDAEPIPTDADVEFGAVEVGDVPWSRVTALFADGSEAESVGPARAAVAGLTLDDAWEHPAVQAALEADDLLWHGPGEWHTLVAG